MCGCTRTAKIQNDCIREDIGMTPTEEKMTIKRSRKFGHVQRGPLEALLRRVKCMVFSLVKKGRGGKGH